MPSFVLDFGDNPITGLLKEIRRVDDDLNKERKMQKSWWLVCKTSSDVNVNLEDLSVNQMNQVSQANDVKEVR